MCNVMVLQSRHIRQRALIPSIRGRHRMAGLRSPRRETASRIESKPRPGRRAVRPPLPDVTQVGLPRRPIETGQFTDGWPPLWWVGCHGGAGTTTLATLTGLGIDAGAAWPDPLPGLPSARVVLVCRATASGALAASVAVEQWRRRAVPAQTQLLGVVAVEGSARKPPRRATERLRLLAGWVPATWRVGWVEEFLAADNAGDVGLPPDVATLQHALRRAIHSQ